MSSSNVFAALKLPVEKSRFLKQIYAFHVQMRNQTCTRIARLPEHVFSLGQRKKTLCYGTCRDEFGMTTRGSWLQKNVSTLV